MTPPSPLSGAPRLRSYRGVPGNAPIALWAVPVADLDGVARHVLDVARQGIPDTRLVVLCPDGPLAQELKEKGVPVLVEDFGPKAGISASIRSLRHAVATLRPAVLHTHLAYADIVAALAVPASWPVRLVSTEHGIAAPGRDAVYHGTAVQSRLMSAVHTARCGRFDALIAVSEAAAEAMKTAWHPRRRVQVSPNGVDLSSTPPQRAPGLRLLSLARLAPEKQIGELLKAFSLLHRDQPEATLTVAGTGPLDKELRRTAEVLGVQSSVSFPGLLNADEALASHDVLIDLSAQESCSYAVLDAVQAGLGVVAAPLGSACEVLPASCLSEATDLTGLAQTLLAQGADLSARPAPSTLPSVRTTVAHIRLVYRGCFA